MSLTIKNKMEGNVLPAYNEKISLRKFDSNKALK